MFVCVFFLIYVIRCVMRFKIVDSFQSCTGIRIQNYTGIWIQNLEYLVMSR